MAPHPSHRLAREARAGRRDVGVQFNHQAARDGGRGSRFSVRQRRPLNRARPPTPSPSRPGSEARGRGRSRGPAVHYVGQGASAPRAAVAPEASGCRRRRNGVRRLRRASYLHSPAVIFICGGNEVVSSVPSVAEPDIQIALPAPLAPARGSREPRAARARPASPLRPATARASPSSPAPLSPSPSPFPSLLCPARLSPRNQPPFCVPARPDPARPDPARREKPSTQLFCQAAEKRPFRSCSLGEEMRRKGRCNCLEWVKEGGEHPCSWGWFSWASAAMLLTGAAVTTRGF
ncbi:uncharacterized protein LOC105714011 [Aotus nancymaae]|uniref:uncharacterized protein LOC105714011 n=1 Tax=Aotus nancymaae TaxID=37293 RepID=UPI0030FEB69F